MSDISSGLKAIAKELDVPVLALSQLSRAAEQRENKRPQLSDLRDSGSIEQDADVVLFLYREGMHNREIDRGKTELIVAKNRNGPVDELHSSSSPSRPPSGSRTSRPSDRLPA